jgi:polyketide synthase PksN
LTQHEPLDFFAVFPPVAALMPNQDSDYAAANSFLDSFVEARNRLTATRHGPAEPCRQLALWASGGMRVAPEEERHLLRVFGMKPLPASDGLVLFETALAPQGAVPRDHQIISLDGDWK